MSNERKLDLKAATLALVARDRKERQHQPEPDKTLLYDVETLDAAMDAYKAHYSKFDRVCPHCHSWQTSNELLAGRCQTCGHDEWEDESGQETD